MINTDRVVPITAIDLISMYGTIIKLASEPDAVPVVLETTTTNGIFEITGSNGNFLMNEPMKSCNIATGDTTANVFFVPAYDYSGFTVNGAAVTTDGDEVTADGRTLYYAIIGDGEVEIRKVGY